MPLGPRRPDRCANWRALSPQAGVIAATTGIAFGWAGGAPPFTVTFESPSDGALLARGHTERRHLWLPGWDPPPRDFVVTVHDGLGAELRHPLHSLPSAPFPDRGVAEAIQMYETVPEYRMEALRRVAARAEAGDDIAEHAVNLIYDGGTQ
jgi:hypothetical protein